MVFIEPFLPSLILLPPLKDPFSWECSIALFSLFTTFPLQIQHFSFTFPIIFTVILESLRFCHEKDDWKSPNRVYRISHPHLTENWKFFFSNHLASLDFSTHHADDFSIDGNFILWKHCQFLASGKEFMPADMLAMRPMRIDHH